MQREIHQWHSPHLNRTMELAVYGHYGFALLLFPTATADHLEHERFLLIEALRPQLQAGKLKVFSVDSVNRESWFNDQAPPRQKAVRQQQYNAYLAEEVLPFVQTHCRGRVLTIAGGAGFGALLAANALFRRPDLIDGCIGLSGTYDLKPFTGGYWDEDVYFNSPLDYLPQLADEAALARLRAKRHLYFISGQGAHENPGSATALGRVLAAKAIPHEVDLWGPDVNHDWPWWRKMLPHCLETKF